MKLQKSTLRFSFGKIHSEDDINYIVEQLSIILKRLEKNICIIIKKESPCSNVRWS